MSVICLFSLSKCNHKKKRKKSSGLKDTSSTSPGDRLQETAIDQCLAIIVTVQDPEIWHQCLTHLEVQSGEGLGHQQRCC